MDSCKYDIFICFKSEDKLIAENLYAFLRSKNFSVFFSGESLKDQGDINYNKVISRAINDTTNMVVIASKPEYLDTSYVNFEWNLFLSEKKSGRKPDGDLYAVLGDGIALNQIDIELRNKEIFTISNYEEKLPHFLKTRKRRLLTKHPLNGAGNTASGGLAAYYDEKIILSESDGLYICRADLLDKKKLLSVNCYNIAAYSNYIYFINSNDYFIYTVNLKGENLKPLISTKCQAFVIAGNALFYLEKNTGYIKKCGLDGKNREDFITSRTDNFTVDGNLLFYTSANALYRTDIRNSTLVELITQGDCDFINSCADGLVFKDAGKRGIFLINKSGERTVLCNDYADFINVAEERIFYQNNSSGGRLYVINTDGTGKQELTKESVGQINIAGDYLFYTDKFGKSAGFIDIFNSKRDRGTEVIDVFDEALRLTGTATKKKAHEEGLWHKTVHCWLVRPGKIIFQKRSGFKKFNPDKFDISCAGHCESGESIEAGVREIYEELGVTVDPECFTDLGLRVDVYKDDVHINREFTNVVFWEDGRDISEFALCSDEVSGLAEIDLDDAENLFSGKVKSINADYYGSREGTKTTIELTLSDFVPTTGNYYKQIVFLAKAYFAGIKGISV